MHECLRPAQRRRPRAWAQPCVVIMLLSAGATAGTSAEHGWTGAVSKAEETALFAPPPVKGQPGFVAAVVVPPGGRLLDPLTVIAHLVESGFSNPAGIAFGDRSIWVADVNRDGPLLRGQ